MTDADVIHIAAMTLMVTAKVCAPILLVSLGVGLAISLIQSVTQIQEITLTFVPKLMAVAVVILFTGNWMLAQIVGFTRELFALIPSLIGA